MCVFLLGMGVVSPLATARALSPFGEKAGAASALVTAAMLGAGLADALGLVRVRPRLGLQLTAQARLSGVILGMLPIGFFAFLLVTSREEMLNAIGTPLGGTSLGIGLVLELLAFVWIRHLLEVR